LTLIIDSLTKFKITEVNLFYEDLFHRSLNLNISTHSYFWEPSGRVARPRANGLLYGVRAPY
ncbi:MAG: hypothetical protein J7L07_07560, partial [Candidatus Odinarchaeota archaeon]|nr:hypothetical protein [Candidatus Odinarchaeota archaeon]